jgi:D-alanyl-D-alanine dipeptidase
VVSDLTQRDYWISYMDEMRVLFERLRAYPCEESDEALGSISDAMSAADVEVLFSDTLIAGELERIFFVRERLLPDLVAIARDMNARGWILKFEDGFRTREMQTRLGRSPEAFDRIVKSCVWECGGGRPSLDLVSKRASVLVANCGKSGTHTQGAAVDISIFDRDDGAEVWRGGPYLEMSALTPMASPFVSAEEHASRVAITKVMERHGFMHYPGEFWHYNKGDCLYQILTGGGAPGIYGPIHWDSASGTVTPYDDPAALLTSPERMATEIESSLRRIGTG